MIIVDTSVVSELMKPSPSEPVIEWLRARTGSELFTTSITLAEILYGITRLPDGRRKELLTPLRRRCSRPSRIRCCPPTPVRPRSMRR
jgi:toxin FitB